MTSDISWIRLALTARYPNIIKEKGADLDNNGKIEENETFGDLDGSGAIDDKDFRKYLERNRPSIANQIEFFKWQGNNISDDNIINHLMFLKFPSCTKEEVRKAYEKINAIISRIKEKLSGTRDPKDMLRADIQILQKDFSINFKNEDNSCSFIENLLHGSMDCYASTFTSLAIAHEFQWPLYAVQAPRHVFTRWDDGKCTFNFDPRFRKDIRKDKYYQKYFKIDGNAIKNGVYLRSLSQEETVGLFYDKVGIAKSESGKYQEAIKDFSEAIRLNPKLASAYNNRGIAEAKSRKYTEAIDDYTKAIGLDPKLAAAFRNRGIAQTNSGNYTEAIADHTEAIKIDGTYAAAYYSRGLAKAASGDPEGASKDFTEAKKIEAERRRF